MSIVQILIIAMFIEVLSFTALEVSENNVVCAISATMFIASFILTILLGIASIYFGTLDASYLSEPIVTLLTIKSS